ncbi:MAG: hypothetical protein BMS9Abin39_0403 [Ignavibacteria bacterium]|nr:MAG: hypothetical protein BMS9Abin39_0403 [Ignavibacteria bacterium]
MHANKTPLVSIIIVSFNNKDTLENTLNSMHEKIKETNFEVIVVDNASVEDNVNMIREKFADVIIIENRTNKGFAHACNQGAKIAEGEYLLFANSDIILLDDPLKDMMNIFGEKLNTGIVGCQLLNPDHTLQPSYYDSPSLLKRFFDLIGLKKYLVRFYHNHKVHVGKFFTVDIVKGAFMMISKTLFDDCNGFDSKYFMYMEDVDLSFRCLLKNKKNYVLNSNSVIHLGWHVSSIKNPIAFTFGNYGLIRFYKKNTNLFKFNGFLFMNISIYALQYLFKFLFSNNKFEVSQLKKVLKLYMASLIKQEDVDLLMDIH